MSWQYFNHYNLDGFPRVRKWNPVAMRCERVDDGCRHCWHLAMCGRLAKNNSIDLLAQRAYAGKRKFVVREWNRGITLAICPSVIAVQFMGDLWGNVIPQVTRDHVLFICSCNAKHIFLFLTKRPENVTEELPKNCWLGTSVHDQASAEVRIPQLLAAKARRKWLSVEPMLGAVNLGRTGAFGCDCFGKTKRIGFVACGPETGRGARPCDPGLIADVAAQCAAARVPFYDKRDPSAAGFTRREWPEEWKKNIFGEWACEREKESAGSRPRR